MKNRPASSYLTAFALAVVSAASCASQKASAPTAAPVATAAASGAAAAPPAAAVVPVAAATTPPPAVPGEVVGPPTVAWKDMTKEQRGKFMKAVITPRMKEVFQAFDAEDFKSFGCKTCHGDKAKDVGFKMPNPDLTQLPHDAAGFAALREKKEKWMNFMGGEVTPKMAALLGVERFEPSNPKPGAFGCMGCHTTKS